MHSANDGKSLDKSKWKIPILHFFFFLSDEEKCVRLWMFYFNEVASSCELPGPTVPVEERPLLCDLEAGRRRDGWKHIKDAGESPKPGLPAWRTSRS